MRYIQYILTFLYFIILITTLYLLFKPNDMIVLENKSFINTLDKNGLINLKEVFDDYSIQRINSLFNLKTKTVNYHKFENEIIPKIKNKIDNILGWDVQLQTYRISNKENLKGASGFHRDDYNFISKNNSLVPSFTIIVYLDDADFEYIPESHLYKKMNLTTALKKLNNPTRITLKRGDVIVMYGSLIHKGIDNTNINRRLIQFFVSMPSVNSVNQWKDDMLIKWGTKFNNNVNNNIITNILPILNKFYGIQQACLIQLPFIPNYIDKKYRNKYVIPFSLPTKKINNETNKLDVSILLKNNKINHYTCS